MRPKESSFGETLSQKKQMSVCLFKERNVLKTVEQESGRGDIIDGTGTAPLPEKVSLDLSVSEKSFSRAASLINRDS